MSFWITITNDENWGIIKEKGVYAFKKQSDFSKLAEHDIIVIYVKGSKIAGAFSILKLEETQELIFHNKEYKYKLYLKKEVVPNNFLELKNGKRLNELIPQLELFKYAKKWGAVLMGKSLLKITEKDYELIKKSLKEVKE